MRQRMSKAEIYLDNAATTLPDRRVHKEMDNVSLSCYGNPSSQTTPGKKAAEVLKSCRAKLAKVLHCSSQEIIFTSGATEANVTAMKGVLECLFYQTKGKRNHLITTKGEHSSILECCTQLKKRGFTISYLNIDKQGRISLEEFEKTITGRTALVSIQAVNNETGVLQDLNRIVNFCKKKEILVHTDTVQGFTKIPFDIQTTPVDLASFSAHKIHGPKGIGALYLRKGVEIFPIFPGTQESNLRAGTENLPAIAGFVKAAELFTPAQYISVRKLSDMLIKEITSKITNCFLIGHLQHRAPHIVNIFFRGVNSEDLLQYLNAEKIYVSTASACKQQTLERSHVLEAMEIPEDGGNVRFSLSVHTTIDEIKRTIAVLIPIIASLRIIKNK